MDQMAGTQRSSDQWEADSRLWIARFHGEKITKFGESEMANRKRHWELRNWGEEGLPDPRSRGFVLAGFSRGPFFSARPRLVVLRYKEMNLLGDLRLSASRAGVIALSDKGFDLDQSQP